MRPSLPADARMWATYLFHVTEVIYEPSWGLVLGFEMTGDDMSLATSRINKDVEPYAKKLFFKGFHYAQIIGYPSYSTSSAYKKDFWSSIWAYYMFSSFPIISAGSHKVSDPFYIPPNIKPYGWVPYFYPNVPQAKHRYDVLYKLLP